MPGVLRNIRPLYLLALFQLVGGPVALLVVMFLGKVCVTRVAEHGLTHGISKALQSEEWQPMTSEWMQEGAVLPGTEKDKAPAKNKGKEAKGKLFVSEMERPVMAPVCEVKRVKRWTQSDAFVCVRAQAPPGPPPTVA